MRLSNEELPRAGARYSQRQLPALELLRLEQIRQAIDAYRAELDECIPADEKDAPRPSSASAIIARYIDRYRAQLFGHPARFDVDGRVIAVVDRTNNVAERFFGQDKRGLRRRVGRVHLGRDLELQPAQVALVSNLRSPAHVRLLCGSLAQLPSALATAEAASGVESATLTRDNRDKPLQRLVRRMLTAADVSPASEAEQNVRRTSPRLDPPALSPGRPDLEDLTEEQVRSRCAEVFSPPKDSKKPPRRRRLPPAGSVAKRHSQGPLRHVTVLDRDRENLTEKHERSRRKQAVSPPKDSKKRPRDRRLPPAGSVIERHFRGHLHRVTVLEDGFVYRGQRYATLSAVTRRITGNSSDGYRFFILNEPWAADAPNRSRRRCRRTIPPHHPAATES